jgi:ABC-type transport system substrate-binding protein
VDRLLTQARRVSDVSFRTSLYQELQEIIEADAVSIPLMHTMTAIGVADGVMGFEPQITGEEVLWKIQLIKTQN